MAYSNRCGSTDAQICLDCAMAAFNNDYSGMDEKTEARVRAHIGLFNIYPSEDSIIDFSQKWCDTCKTHLGGFRVRAYVELRA